MGRGRIFAQEVAHRGVAAAVTLRTDLAWQSARGQTRIADDPLAQIGFERLKPACPQPAGTLARMGCKRQANVLLPSGSTCEHLDHVICTV